MDGDFIDAFEATNSSTLLGGWAPPIYDNLSIQSVSDSQVHGTKPQGSFRSSQVVNHSDRFLNRHRRVVEHVQMEATRSLKHRKQQATTTLSLSRRMGLRGWALEELCSPDVPLIAS
jgi:hypothetical protein